MEDCIATLIKLCQLVERQERDATNTEALDPESARHFEVCQPCRLEMRVWMQLRSEHREFPVLHFIEAMRHITRPGNHEAFGRRLSEAWRATKVN